MNKMGHALRVFAPAVFLAGCASDFDKCFEVELQKAWQADAQTVACAEYSRYSDDQRLDSFRAILDTLSAELNSYGVSSVGDLSWAALSSAFEAEDPGVRESVDGCSDSADSELVSAIEENMADRVIALHKESDLAEAAQALLMGADEIHALAAEERAKVATKVCNGRGLFN